MSDDPGASDDESEWGSGQRYGELDEQRHTEQQWGQKQRQSGRGRSDSLLSGSGTLLNALLGALTGVVLSFVPFATVLGGGVAGYLEADPGKSTGQFHDGLVAGGMAGAMMFLPFVLIGFVLFGLLSVAAPPLFQGFLFGILLVGFLYIVGAGMLGGVLGVYVHRELTGPRR